MIHLFSLTAFKIFFWQFDYVSGCGSLWVYPTWNSLSIMEINTGVFSLNWERFWPWYFQIFCFTITLLFFWDFCYIYVGTCDGSGYATCLWGWQMAFCSQAACSLADCAWRAWPELPRLLQEVGSRPAVVQRVMKLKFSWSDLLLARLLLTYLLIFGCGVSLLLHRLFSSCG